MKTRGINIDVFCEFHQAEKSQIETFVEMGLIEIQSEEGIKLIPESEIEQLERCLRLSNELGVNTEGLEIIVHMREKMIAMRGELEEMRQLLDFESGKVKGTTILDFPFE